jgi:hypothetical protein
MQAVVLSTAGLASSDTTAVLPKFVAVSVNGSGNNTLVAAVTGKKIRVLSGHLTMSGTAVTWTFQSGAGGTGLTGALAVAQNGSISFPFSPVGHFETAAGSLLNLSLSGAQLVTGYVVYIEV